MIGWSPAAVAAVVVAAVALALLRRGGIRNGLLALAGFFALFAFGPLINIARGEVFFSGIALRNLDGPVVGFALALAAVAVVHVAMPQRLEVDRPTGPRGDYLLLPWVHAAAALIGLAGLARLGSLSLDKLTAIATIGSWHYPYLLLQLLAVSTYFMCRTRLARRAWFANLAVYVVYALATSERDFLLALAAVLIHRELFMRKRRSGRAVGLAALAAVVASALAAGRAAVGSTSTLTDVLNQGSILFIDSNLSRFVPAVYPHEGGRTYVDAVLRPLGLSDAAPLPEWFVAVYAPGNPSGYGFSLSGEAYLNFGLLGVPAVFALLAAAQRGLMNTAGRSDFRCYMSVLFLVAALYALRGDSAQLLTTMLYGAVFFAVVASVRVDPARLRSGRDGAGGLPRAGGAGDGAHPAGRSA